MKINNVGISQVIKNYGSQNKDSPQQAGKPKKTDELSLSGEAKQLQKVKQKIDYSRQVRQEKVAKFKQQLKQGNYNVDGEEVAEKMINSVINQKA